MNPLILVGIGLFGLLAIGSLAAGFIFTRRESDLSGRLESVVTAPGGSGR